MLQLQKYTWLIDTIRRAGKISLEEISDRWQRNKDLSGYSDGGSVSSYAVEALQWATGAGLITDMGDGTLNPQGSATRAQVATILMRFLAL